MRQMRTLRPTVTSMAIGLLADFLAGISAPATAKNHLDENPLNRFRIEAGRPIGTRHAVAFGKRRPVRNSTRRQTGRLTFAIALPRLRRRALPGSTHESSAIK